MTVSTMEATFEVTYGPTTVRLWLDAKDMPSSFDTTLEAEWAPKIESWLFDRFAPMEAGERSAKVAAQRTSLAELFDRLAAVPGILAAQIVEGNPIGTANSKRGFLVRYGP